MSADHKRPLLAFVLVALVCSMIIANGVRTQADVVSVVRASAQHLVAGVEFVVTDAPRERAPISDSEPELTPVGPVEVAAQQVFGGGHSVSPSRHRTTKRQAKAHAHSRSREEPRGHPALGRTHDHGQGHSKGHDQSPAKKPGKGHDLNKGLVTSHGKAHTKSHGKGHAKSHGKAHGKAHAKSHGKGR